MSETHERPAASSRNEHEQAWRSDFDVDADRVLYSPEFRRLAGVTQVISPQDDYVLHDRLTHSLKVAQVAERLAEKLSRDAVGKTHERESAEFALALRTLQDDHLHPRVCYVAGLCHDLGHPPYGHAAEVQLQNELRSFRSFTDLDSEGNEIDPDRPRDVSASLPDGFEGNAQSFRIVSTLSMRKATDSEQPGMNLTYRSLAAISKYPWQRGDIATATTQAEKAATKKWGFYASEARFEKAMQDKGLFHETDGSGPYPRRRSVEAEVMDWADDIAYAVHDLEDFFRTNQVPLDRLSVPLPTEPEEPDKQIQDGVSPSPEAVTPATPEPGSRLPEEWEPIIEIAASKLQKAYGATTDMDAAGVSELRRLAEERIAVQMPSKPFSGDHESHADLHRFAGEMIYLLQNSIWLDADDANLRLVIPDETRKIVELLKAINVYYVIDGSTVDLMQAGQRRVVSELFRTLHELAYKTSTFGNERRLPARLREYLEVSLGAGGDRTPDPALLDSNENQASAVVFAVEDPKSADATADQQTPPEGAISSSPAVARAVVDFLCSLTDKQASLLHQRITGDSSPTLSPYWLNI